MAAFDQPDVGVIGPAADGFVGENLEQLGVERSLIQQQG